MRELELLMVSCLWNENLEPSGLERKSSSLQMVTFSSSCNSLQIWGHPFSCELILRKLFSVVLRE